MYTSYIGKKLLALYNQRNNTNLSAKGFFDEVMFSLFFNHERHLMNVSNSPFFQKVSVDALQKAGGSKAAAQLNKLHQDIDIEVPNGAMYVGYAAKDIKGTTSGQVTSISLKIDSEEMFASWIGAGLGVGVGSKYSILIDNDDIVWATFQGWKIYRYFLDQTPNLKGNQIESWNSHWLSHVFSKNYHENKPIALLNWPECSLCQQEKLKKLGFIEFGVSKWSKTMHSFSRKFSGLVLAAYTYSLSDTNKTVGFINIYLRETKRLFEVHDQLFGVYDEKAVSEESITELYDTHYSFSYAAITLGSIGLRALEPDKLREYMPYPLGRGDDFKFKDANSYVQYQLFKTWIYAMLSNKAELNRLAEQVATTLLAFEGKNKENSRGTTGISQLSKTLQESKNYNRFVENMTGIMEKDNSTAALFKEVKDAVLPIPADLFPLFITLVRFEYQYQKSVQPKS